MLSTNNKKRLIDYLFIALNRSIFADEMLEDMILYGVDFKGLNNMDDEELVSMYEGFNTDDTDEDEFLIELRAEVAIHKMLKDGGSGI